MYSAILIYGAATGAAVFGAFVLGLAKIAAHRTPKRAPFELNWDVTMYRLSSLANWKMPKSVGACPEGKTSPNPLYIIETSPESESSGSAAA